MFNRLKSFMIDTSLNRPGSVILFSICLTLLFVSGIRWVVIDDDMFKLLPEDLPSRRMLDEIQEEFGSTDILIIAFGTPGKSIMTPKALEDAWDLTTYLETRPEVDEVIGIANFTRMDADDGFIEVSDLQPHRRLTEEEIESIKDYLDRNPDLKNRVLSRKGDYLQLVVRPETGVESNILAAAVDEAIKKNLHGYVVRPGGYPYVRGSVPVLIREDVFRLLKIGVLIMLAVMLGTLRNVSAVGIIISVIGLSAAAMMGFMGWIVHLTGSSRFYFSIMNTSMPVILLSIANSDGVHIIARFFKERRRIPDNREALQVTMNALMLPVLMTSVTTAGAFLTLISTPIRAMTGYGVTIAFGIMWAWFLSATLIPSLVIKKKWNTDSRAFTKESLLERFVVKAGAKLRRKPVPVLFSGIVVVLAMGTGIPLVNVEINVVSFFRHDNPIRKNFDFLDEEMNGTINMAVRVRGDIKDPENLEKMEKIQQFIESHPSVKGTVSIVDVIKNMHKLVMDDDPRYETIPESRDQVNNLFTLYSMSGDPDDFSSLVDYDYRNALITAMMKSIPSDEIVEFVEETKKFCSENIGDEPKLDVTGVLVVLRDFVDLVVRSSLISIAASILVVFIITFYFFKSFRWGALSVIPLVGAVIMNFGMMGYLKLDLSHVTALLTSLIIGVGVDFAVHYISQFRHYAALGVSKDEITKVVMDDVGYPILLDAGSNMGFAAVIFSTFLPIEYAGGLIVFAMLSTSLGTLTILAAVIDLMKDKLYQQ